MAHSSILCEVISFCVLTEAKFNSPVLVGSGPLWLIKKHKTHVNPRLILFPYCCFFQRRWFMGWRQALWQSSHHSESETVRYNDLTETSEKSSQLPTMKSIYKSQWAVAKEVSFFFLSFFLGGGGNKTQAPWKKIQKRCKIFCTVLSLYRITEKACHWGWLWA